MISFPDTIRKRLWKFHGQLNRESVTFRRKGTTWTAYPWDGLVSYHLYVWGTWQSREIAVVVEWLKQQNRLTGKRDIIVNVGAHIGTTAITFARDINCRVLAIEPVDDNFKLLRKNVYQNHLGAQIKCHHGAVYDQHIPLKMVIPDGNSGGAEICINEQISSFSGRSVVRKTTKVLGMPLSTILKTETVDPSQVALVWADTQGCEGHVIRTGRELWKKGVPLAMEFWPRGYTLQNDLDVLTLIRKYFSSYSVITDAWKKPLPLTSSPIAELEYSLVPNEKELDILLIP